MATISAMTKMRIRSAGPGLGHRPRSPARRTWMWSCSRARAISPTRGGGGPVLSGAGLVIPAEDLVGYRARQGALAIPAGPGTALEGGSRVTLKFTERSARREFQPAAA